MPKSRGRIIIEMVNTFKKSVRPFIQQAISTDDVDETEDIVFCYFVASLWMATLVMSQKREDLSDKQREALSIKLISPAMAWLSDAVDSAKPEELET